MTHPPKTAGRPRRRAFPETGLGRRVHPRNARDPGGRAAAGRFGPTDTSLLAPIGSRDHDRGVRPGRRDRGGAPRGDQGDCRDRRAARGTAGGGSGEPGAARPRRRARRLSCSRGPVGGGEGGGRPACGRRYRPSWWSASIVPIATYIRKHVPRTIAGVLVLAHAVGAFEEAQKDSYGGGQRGGGLVLGRELASAVLRIGGLSSCPR
jgi:hypothetical protein